MAEVERAVGVLAMQTVEVRLVEGEEVRLVVETVEVGGESSEQYACCTRCASGREPAFVAALAKLMEEPT